MQRPAIPVGRARPWTVTLLAAVILAAAGEAVAQAGPDDDPRKIFSSGSPAWLLAVGSLQVPGSRYSEGRRNHLREDCSATLVTANGSRRADTIVTAWHCLADYNDLSRPITFTLMRGPSEREVHEVYRLADGGGMHADWALLRLYRPIAAPQSPALPIHPGRADNRAPISMAGYSRDEGKGALGSRLTYDPQCRITAQEATSSRSDCRAYKGASGGAVVQLSGEGEVLFSGVISQGDSAGVSTFVPVASFRQTLYRHLR